MLRRRLQPSTQSLQTVAPYSLTLFLLARRVGRFMAERRAEWRSSRPNVWHHDKLREEEKEKAVHRAMRNHARHE